MQGRKYIRTHQISLSKKKNEKKDDSKHKLIVNKNLIVVQLSFVALHLAVSIGFIRVISQAVFFMLSPFHLSVCFARGHAHIKYMKLIHSFMYNNIMMWFSYTHFVLLQSVSPVFIVFYFRLKLPEPKESKKNRRFKCLFFYVRTILLVAHDFER